VSTAAKTPRTFGAHRAPYDLTKEEEEMQNEKCKLQIAN
jgi:hypothetical protein